MKYIELLKETDEIISGISTGEVLPVTNEDSLTYFSEALSYPDETVVYGQVWNSATKTVEDTQTSTNSKSLSYLLSTDWYAIRKAETGVAIPSAVSDLRTAARAAIVG